MTIDERNKMIFDKTQDITLDEIIIESKKNFAALLKNVETLSDDDLISEDFITFKSERGKRPTFDFIGAQNFWHFEDLEDSIIESFDLNYCYEK
jgi:hypothetical protein